MKILIMNDDGKYDIDLSPIQAKINTENLFSKFELPSVNAVNKFISSTHEFKNQQSALLTDNFFVEYAMTVKGNYFNSGILTSEAVLQTYNVNELLISVPTEFILYLYHNRVRLNLTDTKKNDTDYIGHGFLIPASRLVEMYSNYVMENRLKALRNKHN